MGAAFQFPVRIVNGVPAQKQIGAHKGNCRDATHTPPREKEETSNADDATAMTDAIAESPGAHFARYVESKTEHVNDPKTDPETEEPPDRNIETGDNDDLLSDAFGSHDDETGARLTEMANGRN